MPTYEQTIHQRKHILASTAFCLLTSSKALTYSTSTRSMTQTVTLLNFLNIILYLEEKESLYNFFIYSPAEFTFKLQNTDKPEGLSQLGFPMWEPQLPGFQW